MVPIIAGPELTAQGCNSLSCILNDAPALSWLVSLNLVEEVIRENSLLSGDMILLLLVLNLAEVYPSLEIKSIGLG